MKNHNYSHLFATKDIPNIDSGILHLVDFLRHNKVETFESCEGGEGHIFEVPTIRFGGTKAEGLRVISLAMQFDLGADELRRYWNLIDGELTGPEWEITFKSSEIIRVNQECKERVEGLRK